MRINQVLDTGVKRDADGHDIEGQSKPRINKVVADIMTKIVTLTMMEPALIPQPDFINGASLGAQYYEEERIMNNEQEERDVKLRKDALAAEIMQLVHELETM
jgi:hypothetical protein